MFNVASSVHVEWNKSLCGDVSLKEKLNAKLCTLHVEVFLLEEAVCLALNCLMQRRSCSYSTMAGAYMEIMLTTELLLRIRVLYIVHLNLYFGESFYIGD